MRKLGCLSHYQFPTRWTQSEKIIPSHWQRTTKWAKRVLALFFLSTNVIILYNHRSKLVPSIPKRGFYHEFYYVRNKYNTRLKEQNSHKACYNWALSSAAGIRLLFQNMLFLVTHSHVNSQTKTIYSLLGQDKNW